MRALLSLLAAVSLLSFSAAAQETTGPVKENKYRINLPDYWGKGNKVWKILTDKLPLVCEELKDKELCGDDCNPAYTVDFYLTEPEITDYYSKKIFPAASTNTRAVAYVTNPAFRTINLSNPTQPYFYSTVDNTVNSNTWKITESYTFQCYLLLRDQSGKIITKMILVDNNETWNKEYTVNLNNSTTSSPDTYIQNNKETLTPEIKELLAIVDTKFLNL